LPATRTGRSFAVAADGPRRSAEQQPRKVRHGVGHGGGATARQLVAVAEPPQHADGVDAVGPGAQHVERPVPHHPHALGARSTVLVEGDRDHQLLGRVAFVEPRSGDGVDEPCKAGLGEHLGGDRRRLRGGDPDARALAAQGVEQLGHALVHGRVGRTVRPVPGAVAIHHHRGRRVVEPERSERVQQRRADAGAQVVVGWHRRADRLERGAHRGDEVAARVGERAVQVEQDEVEIGHRRRGQEYIASMASA
jgi:hypothetical protein